MCTFIASRALEFDAVGRWLLEPSSLEGAPMRLSVALVVYLYVQIVFGLCKMVLDLCKYCSSEEDENKKRLKRILGGSA